MGAFGSESSALRLQGELQALLTAPVSVSRVQSGDDLLYRVRVGPVADNDELATVQQKLLDSGYGSGQPLP
jgi:rare lipoprotein A